MPFLRIVLIDDDAEDQEIFKTALSQVSAESECVTFTNAQEALAKLLSRELDPDVIFLDLNMPIMTGQDFLKEVKQDRRLRIFRSLFSLRRPTRLPLS